MIFETVFLLLAMFLAYVVGAIPTGLLISHWFGGVDIREHGSGNIGFTNVLRILGWKLGVPVLIIDVAKAAFIITVLSATMSAGFYSMALIKIMLGLAVMLGNLFNMFMGFKGGKGVATALGVFLALSPIPVLVSLGVFLLTFAISRTVSLASLLSAISLPIVILLVEGKLLIFIFGLVIAIFVLIKHQSNIKRLLTGTEHSFSAPK